MQLRAGLSPDESIGFLPLVHTHHNTFMRSARYVSEKFLMACILAAAQRGEHEG